MMNNKNITTYLITGGAGFIGSHLVRRVLESGCKVRVLDNFSSGYRENIPEGIELIEGDVRDVETVKRAVSGVDYVVHLAAQISVPKSINDPITNDEVNSRGTLNVLMVAKDAGVKQFVLASSCAVYGDSTQLPLSEDCPPAPLSPYAITKLAGEYYCKAFYNLHGFRTVALRYFNVFGPGQRPDSQYAAAIPKFVDAISSGRRPTIFGDGEQTRDFVYVGNIAQAIMLACKSEKAAGRVINIGSGTKTSLNELLRVLGKIAGCDVKPVYEDARAGDIRHSVGNISLAKELLGFECEVGLEEGLRRTYEYFT